MQKKYLRLTKASLREHINVFTGEWPGLALAVSYEVWLTRIQIPQSSCLVYLDISLVIVNSGFDKHVCFWKDRKLVSTCVLVTLKAAEATLDIYPGCCSIFHITPGGERGDGEGVGLHASCFNRPISQSAAFIINWRSVLFTPCELFAL